MVFIINVYIFCHSMPTYRYIAIKIDPIEYGYLYYIDTKAGAPNRGGWGGLNPP